MTQKVLAVANQKGGVSKTTVAVNLSASLAALGQKVLLIDLDPQGNATVNAGIDKNRSELTAYDVLLEPQRLRAALQGTSFDDSRFNFQVLAANRNLAGAEIELVSAPDRERRLQQALVTLGGMFDMVLLDCPPSLSLLTLNALVSAHGVLVPMQCEYFALEGLSDLVSTTRRVKTNFNDKLEIIGLVRVMFDPRITLQQQVSDQLKTHFGDKVLDTIVPRNVRLAEAPSHGVPGVIFDPTSRGALAFIDLAKELMKRLAVEQKA